MMAIISEARSATEIAQARTLFQEYAAETKLSLCFQNFAEELASLPGCYSAPEGRLLLAQCNGRVAGCAGLRLLEPGICEMKRLYVRPEFRGMKIGRALVEALIEAATAQGYRRMRLDTLPHLIPALELYRALGFREIAPYRNPNEGVLYLELNLSTTP